MMKTVFRLLIAAVVLCAAVGCTHRQKGQTGSIEDIKDGFSVRYEYGLPVDSFLIDTCRIKDGETLGGLLTRGGATAQQVSGISRIPKSEFDVRSLRATILVNPFAPKEQPKKPKAPAPRRRR